MKEQASLDEALRIKNYTTEARVTAQSTAIGQSISWLQKPAQGDAMVTAIISNGDRKRSPLPDTVLKESDLLIIEGEQAALDRIVKEGKLQLSDRKHEKEAIKDIGSVEAIVGEHSSLIGLSAKDVSLFENTGLNLLAVSRRDKRFSERLGKSRSATVMCWCFKATFAACRTFCASGAACRWWNGT